MSQIKVVDFNDPNAPLQFAKSLRETGFGVIEHHPVEQALIDQCYKDWAAFFEGDDKHNYEFDTKTHAGFVSAQLSETAKGNTVKDLKEFYHLYDWSRCPSYLRPQTLNLMGQLIDMAKTLLGWIDTHAPDDVSSKFSIPLNQMLEGGKHNLFRILRYPPLTGNEPSGAIRAAAHEDIDLLTLLPAATAAGLQAKMSNGEFVEVPINPNWIIVNAGDMLQECSGGYYPSTTHRVMNPVGEAAKVARLSMPFFLHAQDDVVLSEKHTAHTYRWERYEELGLT
jgi:isopenicillin N synthase-like dioxygenase